MTVTSLYALRQHLAAWLAERLPDCEILPGLPDLRRPLPADRCTLVLTVQKLRRCESIGAAGILPLEITLGVTVCHRDSSRACETLTEELALLTAAADFPCRVATLEAEPVEYNRTRAAFLQRMTLTLCCHLSEAEEGADE